MIELLPRFEAIRHLTWLRRHRAPCLKWEFKRHLAKLRRRSDVFALEYETPEPSARRESFVSVVVYHLHTDDTTLDCAPYSQRVEDWDAHKHPGEAIRIAELLERARGQDDSN